MINLQQQLRLGLKLTPQQVQYLKLLQLPTLAGPMAILVKVESARLTFANTSARRKIPCRARD